MPPAARVAWVSELPNAALVDLPDALDGATFLDRWGATDDSLTTVDPDETYPVARRDQRSGSRNTSAAARCSTRSISGRSTPSARSWRPATRATTRWASATTRPTAAVAQVLTRPGVHGARSSGGGSGGTIVVVCERGALDDVDDLIR